MPTTTCRLTALCSLYAVLAACGDKDPAARAAPGPSASAEAAAPAEPSTASPAALATPPIVVEIQPRGGGDAKKVSVVLPPGVMDVSERPVLKEFRKGKDQFEGYALTLAVDEPMRATKGYEMTLGMLDKEKANPAKKLRMIDKGSGDGGWYVAYEFEEGGKRNVSVMASTKVGDASFMCRGDASGPVLVDPGADAAAEVLVASCKSLKTGG